jgi:hypothetical protein
VRYTLIGGHSAGRVVELDDPALSVYVDVPYRVPADPFDVPLDPGEITLGIERYERMIISPAWMPGPPIYGYVCPDVPK